MAFHNDPVLLFYLLLAIVVVGYLISLSVRARRSKAPAEAGGGATQPPLQEDEKRPGEDLLLKFVEDAEGKRYGETVAVEEGSLIIKDGQSFYKAPVEHFEESAQGVLVKGDVDWAAAKEAGEAWRERSTKVIEYDEEEIPPEDLRED